LGLNLIFETFLNPSVEFLLVLFDLAYFLGGGVTGVSPSSPSVAFELSPS